MEQQLGHQRLQQFEQERMDRVPINVLHAIKTIIKVAICFSILCGLVAILTYIFVNRDVSSGFIACTLVFVSITLFLSCWYIYKKIRIRMGHASDMENIVC